METQETTDLARPKILIVDDRPENILALERTLKKMDAELMSASSGNEALIQTIHHDFALILLDVQMPGMSGYEVAQLLRQEEKTKNTPIIFITAIDREETREIQGYDAGAVDFIFKPINPHVLFSKSKVFVELYRNRKELEDLLEKLKTTQMQLIHSEKLASIGQLAAGVAHEINNPIGFVSSNLSVLKDYVALYLEYGKLSRTLEGFTAEGKSEEARNLLPGIASFKEKANLDYVDRDVLALLKESEKGLERVKNIVTDLRKFSRVNQEEFSEVDLEAVLEEVLNLIQHEIKYKAELNKDYGKVPKINGNAQSLSQVFINLLVNAIQAMEKKGEIFIKTYETEGYVCVDIRDTGKGIEEKSLKKIFDPFYTTKPVGEGTGLGLSISYEIIKKHNGQLLVQSRVSEGTTFTIRLPIIQG